MESGIACTFGISVIFFLLAISLLTILPSSIPRSSAESPGPWTATTNYPEVIADHSCVVSSGYIYCRLSSSRNKNSVVPN